MTREIVMAMCPVCKSEAEVIDPGTFDGVWFRCLKHREFGVSDTALKTRKDAESGAMGTRAEKSD